jgi:hypothetical protein
MPAVRWKISLIVVLPLALALGMILFLDTFFVAHAQIPTDPDRAAAGETIWGIVEFDGVRVYSGPDFAYDVIGELQQNMSVSVVGRRGDFFYAWTGEQWLEFEFEGETAWVYARMLRTSIPFNSIPPTGRPLPRNLDGRVAAGLDLSEDICNSWTGEFTRTGDFMNGDTSLIVTYPPLPGATVYSVIVISPGGQRTAHDSITTTAEILLDDISPGGGTFTWRVAPYFSYTTNRREWQQMCLLQTGGTFEVAGAIVTPRPTRPYWGYFPRTPQPTPTPIPFAP